MNIERSFYAVEFILSDIEILKKIKEEGWYVDQRLDLIDWLKARWNEKMPLGVNYMQDDTCGFTDPNSLEIKVGYDFKPTENHLLAVEAWLRSRVKRWESAGCPNSGGRTFAETKRLWLAEQQD